MKQIVGVSIGSSKRDHEVKVKLLGEDFTISRIGTDGDLSAAVQKIKELDGKVDAIGLGGIDLYFVVDGKKYVVRDAKQLKNAASKTEVVDGSGLKDTLERATIKYLSENKIIDFSKKKILMVAAIDRFGMAEAFVDSSASMIFGDLIFGLDIPIAVRKFSTFKFLGKIIVPIITKLPFKVLYPTGDSQEKESTGKYAKYYQKADIIAGDFLLIKKHLPKDVSGKWIITNTTTKEDVAELKKRGLKCLVTTTPVFEGRSFGTNVMEATLVALLNKRENEITKEDYLKCLKDLDFKPRVEMLN